MARLQDWFIPNTADLEDVTWDLMNGERLPSVRCAQEVACESSAKAQLREIAAVIAGGSMEATTIGVASQEASMKIGFEPDEVATCGQRSKMATVAPRAGYVEQL